MGVLEVLTVLFVALKLLGVITWSWWVVFLPLVPAILIYVVIFFTVGFSFFSIFRNFK